MVVLQSRILEKLRCYQCNEYLSYAPIMITQDGDNLCGRCVTESSDETLIRNKAYEEVASITAFPCRYKESGCDMVLPWDDIIFHEDHCEYRLYKCPAASTETCDWEGSQTTILDHYKETHPELILENPCSLDTNIVVDNDKHMLLSFLGFVFLVQIRCETSLSKLWHCVHCLEQPKLARQFSFCLQFNSNVTSIKTEKSVLAEKSLAMQINKSIETNVNHLLGILGDYKNVKCVLSILPKVDSDLQKLFVCPKCKDSKLPAIFRLDDKCYCINCTQTGSFLDRNMEYLYSKMLKICQNNYGPCTFINNMKLVCRHEIWECKWQKKCLFNCALNVNELQNHFANTAHQSKLSTWLQNDIWHYGQIKINNNIIIYKCFINKTTLQFYIYTQLPVEEINLYKCTIELNTGGIVTLKCTPTAEHDWEICEFFGKNPHIENNANSFYIQNIKLFKDQ